MLPPQGSMQKWIDKSKEKIKEIVEQAQTKFNLPLRTAFVGYRDFDCLQDRYEVCDFKSEAELDQVSCLN